MQRSSTSARIACPGHCGDREDCFVHQEHWEPVAGRVVTCNYTFCNHCSYEASELVVPANFTIRRSSRM